MAKSILAFIFLSFLFGVVGKDDLREEIEFQDIYCEKVRAGIWGNYQNKECDEKLAIL